MDSKWKSYYGTIRPTCGPHEIVDTSELEDSRIWKRGKIARWTSNFDCGFETDWWYCIKDTQFDIDQVSSKKRYEIRKGISNFDVRLINPHDNQMQLQSITRAALRTYEAWNRLPVKQESMENHFFDRTDLITF